MERLVIKNGKLITPFRMIENGAVLVEDGKIRQIIPDSQPFSFPDAVSVDAAGCYVAPGFIDLHVHGGGGGDVMDATPEALDRMGNLHAAHGTTSYTPTTEASSWGNLYQALDNLRQYRLPDQGPNTLGIHLEGPYLSSEQAGAQDKNSIFQIRRDDYLRLLDYADRIARVTLAPEIDGAAGFIYELRKRNIQVSIGHTNADYDQVIQAIETGCTSVTHLYSCTPGVRRINAYRIAGTIEAALLRDELYVEVIADGCHLPPALLKLIFKCKGSDRIILVSDAIRAAGLPEGEYDLGASGSSQKIIVEDGVAKLPDRQAFAGSVATADRLVRNMVLLAGVPICDAVKMMTVNPAKLLGVEDRKGSLAAGMDADIVVFDHDIAIRQVIINGKMFHSDQIKKQMQMKRIECTP